MSVNKEQYLGLIKLLVPINELSPQLQNEVISMAKVEQYKKKQFIFKQGDRDDFSFYVLDGQIELLSNKQVQNSIESGTDSARYAMARLQPRQFSARAKTEVVILQLVRSALDRLMVLDQEDKTDITSTSLKVSEIVEEEEGDWMTKMLQSELFCRLPTANIHQLFALLEPVEMKAGETVITQGEPGEEYYIIQEGRCEVTRSPTAGAKPIKLAELRNGDSFGEEALLTDSKRNASVTMLTFGVLMKLSKENFINLIKKPTLDSVNYDEGKKLVDEGAIWLDVRFPNEYEESKIEGSMNISLNALRMQTDKLQQDKKYVIYCDTGGRSSAAAFLLTDRGFNVCYLVDGLSSVPQSSLDVKTQEQPSSPPPAKKEEPKEEKIKESDIEPDIRSSVIEADLAKTNIDLEESKKRSAEKKEIDAETKAAQAQLEKEKKKLEAEKRAAEKEAKKVQEQEAAKIKKLKQEAEKRLADEKKKLEEIYTRNTKEMEKLEKMRKEAEEQIRKEREKLENDTAAARQKLEEDAKKRLEEQAAMEKAIQSKAKVKLEEERRKLAEEMSRSNEVLEQANKEKVAAEAARKAAENEAKKIIEEYKKQFEKERAAEEARLEKEKKKLEEQSKQIQETLRDIQSAKKAAEDARVAAEKDAQALKEKQKKESTTQDESARKATEDEIKAAEEKLQLAKKNLEDAQEAENKIEEAREVNEQELLKQKEIEEQMRKQVEADLSEFLEDQKEQEKKRDRVVAHTDHVKRIKERAEAAKKEAQSATDNLFADIAAQLGEDD